MRFAIDFLTCLIILFFLCFLLFLIRFLILILFFLFHCCYLMCLLICFRNCFYFELNCFLFLLVLLNLFFRELILIMLFREFLDRDKNEIFECLNLMELFPDACFDIRRNCSNISLPFQFRVNDRCKWNEDCRLSCCGFCNPCFLSLLNRNNYYYYY